MTAAGPLIPQNLEAEKSVLGAILVNNDTFADVGEILEPADFARVAHRRIYEAMKDLANARTPIDFVTLRDRLTARGDLEECGGPVYLVSLSSMVPHSVNADAYARIVREHADRGRLRVVADKILTAVAESDRSAGELINEAEQAIFALAEHGTRAELMDAPALVAEGFPYVERLLEQRPGITGLRTGFDDLDAMTRGLQPGLVLIGARPSMGKTALALGMAWNAAKRGDVVAFFSVEMSRQELVVRLLSMVGKIDGHHLASGYVQPNEYPRIGTAFAEIGGSGLHVDDSSTLGVLDVLGRARRLKARRGLRLVVIDYLQLMKMPRAENRNLALADVSRALKLVSKELGVPVVVLSQLSRDSEKRAGSHRPQLSDLRDSGALEQDADVVVFLHRPEVYDPTKPEYHGLAELIIAKQRNAPTGTIQLDWIKTQTRFANRGDA